MMAEARGAGVEARQGTGASLLACWSCHGPVPGDAAFCAACRALQPPTDLNHFRRFDFPAAFDLEREEMERRYFSLQRRFHPDRFANKSAKEKLYSVQHAAALNQAFAALKDPLTRAEYLLRLKGRPVSGGESETVADPDLLHEAMTLREELAEAEDGATVAALLAKAEGAIGDIGTALSVAFARNDLDAAARLALRLRYMRKFGEEAKRRHSQIGA